jgi:hypothetical protein
VHVVSRSPVAKVLFCGETYELDPGRPFLIGREGDLVIDSNPFLHRRFLELHLAERLWWLANVGSQLSVTIADGDATMHAWLAPGAEIPLVFPKASVWFSAGPTTYELEVLLSDAPFGVVPMPVQTDVSATTTIRPVDLSPEQRRLVLALCEPSLKRTDNGTSEIPSSAEAAARLGWTLTKFNRKLDTVCEKLAGQGVRGLHGASDRLAVNRRARLVEYGISTRLVTAGDLVLLDTEA